MPNPTSLLRKVLRQPTRVVPVLMALGRGWWYKLWYPITGRRFTAGRNFRVEGRLHVQGPGRVIFGDNVMVGMTVTPWTHHPDAVITVGDGTFLNGARFGCVDRITIGARCIIGESRFMDTNFHSVEINRHDPTAPVTVAPITLGDNVWVAATCGLLPGTQVGTNSVVGFGSVCNGRYPADALIAGNPARVLRSLRPRTDRGDEGLPVETAPRFGTAGDHGDRAVQHIANRLDDRVAAQPERGHRRQSINALMHHHRTRGTALASPLTNLQARRVRGHEKARSPESKVRSAD